MNTLIYTSPEAVDDFGNSVVAEARSWIGTPFHWQQSTKGRGCDCKGLLVGVARALGRSEAECYFAALADYRPGKVPVDELWEGLAAVFDSVGRNRMTRPGDVLLLRVGGAAQHLAIVSEVHAGQPLRMIHCYAKGPAGVIEVPTGHAWRDAIASVWRWKALPAAAEAGHG